MLRMSDHTLYEKLCQISFPLLSPTVLFIHVIIHLYVL